jgi:dTMP kinase
VRGRFIAVEGPNGVGKTTTASRLATRLAEMGAYQPVHLTSEPSDTPLGRLLRSEESALPGRAYALAIAANRYEHIDNEIAPRLDAGQHVITDRYVQSSLVLQRIDDLSLGEIWTYNQHVLIPCVSIYLAEEPDVIGARLAARSQLTRLERSGSAADELRLYEEAYEFLGAQGWAQAKIECRGRSIEAVAGTMLEIVNNMDCK